jgi:hypothetical protein
MKQIPLTRNKVALVDDMDYERVSQISWRAQHSSTQSTWYAIKSGNQWESMHRFIMDCPRDKEVDHINHDGLDNRRENLRIVTKSQNAHNRRNVLGYSYIGYRKKWKAKIMIDGRSKFLGYFNTEGEAAQAYATAKATIFGNVKEDDDAVDIQENGGANE